MDKSLNGSKAKPLVCMMPEIHEVHQFASGEAKPKAQSLPVLVRIVRLGRHENFEIGVPLAAVSARPSLGRREKELVGS